ncbi:MAG TPA: class I SAM-dependent methyltransferase [Pirellulales bacterium]|nr:class I SAM-dependent methyltransferase [Pirellulales bacterium]
MTVQIQNVSPTASLYSELPYPADGVVRTTNARILRAGMQKHFPELLRRQRLRIVDVGCGTGENTVGLAKLFRNAEIVGVDINPASLNLATKLAERTDSPVRFIQCDITGNMVEAVTSTARGQFDVVFSMGVLHHLAEPRAGFLVVRELVKSDGMLFCFLYSRPGRREDIASKELLTSILPPNSSLKARGEAIGLLGLANRHRLWQGLKTLRMRLKFGPPVIPSELLRVALNRNRLAHESDSYSNPCEHLYSCGEIRSLLAETGWDFLAIADGAGIPTSPEQHTRRRAEREFLHRLSEDALGDFFAFYYQAQGISFFGRPSANWRNPGSQ